ncbi:hypothetical protein [Rhizobium rhizogenes]|uniref:hypothetical protein n=1 Tax=Rhizobium rhizogenes TaxID=359 RepID=UPI001571F097|nr:hypothetical protein [Rhizobium rhizogenes]NTI27128.1 hypothetical protein [Rhizobium rhizogenes]
MTVFKLASPRQAEDPLARAFRSEAPVEVLVREEKAFLVDQWLEMGSLRLFCADRDEPEDLKSAVRAGSFEWRVPSQDDVGSRLKTLLGIDKLTETKKKAAAEERLPGIFQAMAGIALRTGLSWPRFDALMISEMPFRRPATIVADTSGVIQGALSFVADYLHPTARLKIPAVLHMEVINQADRFMKAWRSDAVRGETLLNEHLRSQPVQRALLRLELRDDTEVERNPLFGDPLRNAFREDRDSEFKDLNLNIPLKSYVDRMILEVARSHQSHVAPGHEVYLLTADQGLAKMALAEGVRPLYFKAMSASQLFDQSLIGTLLHPFNGQRVARPLPTLLWELATAFGRVKLRRDGVDLVEIAAIGSDLSWSSYHSVDDLLWLRVGTLPDWPERPSAPPISHIDDVLLGEAAITDADVESAAAEPESQGKSGVRKSKPKSKAKRAALDTATATPVVDAAAISNVAFQRFTADGLIRLIDGLASEQRLDDDSIGEFVGLKSDSGIGDYRRFLLSGEFIVLADDGWVATDRLNKLAASLRDFDIVRMRQLLQHAPSFHRFVELVAAAPVGKPVILPLPTRSQTAYFGLGEVAGVVAPIPNEGHYPTLHIPSLEQFPAIALARFEQLGPVDGWAAVGEWLEALIRSDAIHPVIARDLLQEANAANLIKRFTEGSTTNTRHDRHMLKVLQRSGGKIGVETIYLYRGDFLIPGKSSSSLRLQEVN